MPRYRSSRFRHPRPSSSTTMPSPRLLVPFFTFSLALFAIATPLQYLTNPVIPSQQISESIIPTNPHIRRRLLAQSPQSLHHAPEANIAYFLQLSQSTASHLPRLLRRIHHSRNVYAIHFDKKVDPNIVQNVKSAIFSDNPAFSANVFFLKPDLITYRGVSMLLNTINAMKLLLDRPEHWDYFINISGSDYPLVSPLTQRRLLAPHVSRKFNFLTYTPSTKWPVNMKYRMHPLYVDEALSFGDGDSKVRQLSETNPLTKGLNFQYTNAEAWMINSREFCQFVVNSNYARKMLLTFAYSVESSEHYFSTLLWNHARFNRTIVGHALRHVVWVHKGRSSGQHPFYVDETENDGSFTFRDSIDASPNFFIRKFKHANSGMMDYIDSRLDDEDHMKLVKNHLKWVTNNAIREHDAKPALDPEVDYD